jgi:hypothetical protein
MGVEHWWNDSDSKIEVLQENPLPAALCPPRILHLAAGIEPGLSCERPAANCVSHGMMVLRDWICIPQIVMGILYVLMFDKGFY